jgi:BMFP domain-containing protein YqiC
MTSLYKPLCKFHPNFTGMFHIWSPLKTVQRIEFHAELCMVAMATERKNLLLRKNKELELRYLARNIF